MTADEIRAEFRSVTDRVWINTAHQGILPRAAAAATREAIDWKRTPHEMTSERFAGVPSALLSRLGRLLDAPEEEIVLANSSSYGLHLLANGFPWREGDEVLLVRGDFPSTTLPWTGLQKRGVRVRLIDPEGPVVAPDDVARHASETTRIFCTTWVHSFTGHVVDERAIGEACRERDVRFVLNASQGVGARRLRPRELPVDAVTGVGFKWLCGPYGTGFAWIDPSLRDRLEYNQLYWLSFQTARDLEQDRPIDTGRDVGARRYDIFGTANFFNYMAWTASLDLLLEVGIETVARHDQELVTRLVEGVDPGRFEILSPRQGSGRSTLVLVSHRDESRNPDLHQRLQSEGIDIALRRGRLRFSPHLYNTSADIDRALEVLHASG